MKIKTFKEWVAAKELNEGMPFDWEPSPRMHKDTLMSALAKVRKSEREGGMPYRGNFRGYDVIKVRLGLDDEELQALKDAKLIARTEDGGYNVVPSNQTSPSPQMPPPPPQRQGVQMSTGTGVTPVPSWVDSLRKARGL